MTAASLLRRSLIVAAVIAAGSRLAGQQQTTPIQQPDIPASFRAPTPDGD